MQKQSFDQSYKNFWSFVDFNSNIESYSSEYSQAGIIVTGGHNESQRGSSGNNFNKAVTNNFGNTSESTTGNKLSYQEARKRADELLKTQKY